MLNSMFLALSSFVPIGHSGSALPPTPLGGEEASAMVVLAPRLAPIESELRGSSSRIPDDHVFYSEREDGIVWARGATYKARFGPDGATYFPFFGSSAPRHFPVTFGASEVSIDGAPLALATAGEARREGDVVRFERGLLVESYALAPTSMEQTLQFASLPARGAIIVRLPLETELAAHVGEDGSLAFRNELGSVLYSRALAFDAAGRSLWLETEFVDGAIEIRVPAEFVVAAEFPLTIDPLVATIAVDSSSAQSFAADVCYDETSGRFTVVYTIEVGGFDNDVFLRSYDTNGALVIGQDAFVDMTIEHWYQVSIANQNETNKNMILGLVFASGGYLKAALHTHSSGVQAPVILIGPDNFLGISRIGGDPVTGAGTRLFCVVFERYESSGPERDLYARCVLPSGALVGAGDIVLDNTPGQDDHDPSISRSNDGTSWIIAWEREISATNGDIYAARINFDGTVAASAYPVETGSGNYRNPEVSSRIAGSNRYAVVCERVFSDGTRDIFADLMNNTTKEDGTTINFSDGTPDFGAGSPDNFEPQVACDGRHFAISYLEAASVGSANLNVYITDWMQTDTELRLAEPRLLLAGSSTIEQRPRIAAVHSGGGTSRRHMIVWDDNDTNIEGAIYDSVAGGAWSAYCFGDGTGTGCPCGNTGAVGRGCGHSASASGAQLDVLGTVSTTSDNAQLRGRFMPANSTCLYYQGTTEVISSAPPFLPGATFGDGLRCAGGTVIRLTQVTNSAAGLSMFPATTTGTDLHVSGLVPTAGTRRYYQVWYRNAAPFCTASTFNLTNGVVVDWGP